MKEEQLYSLALTKIPGLGLIGAHRLLETVGSATTIFKEANHLDELAPGSSERLKQALNCPDVLRMCEAELKFAEKNQICCLTIQDEDYPSRLRECDDAPIVLFYRGNADLNRLHVINMVGTRHATEYGKDICSHFLRDLSEMVPNVLVVSGLAYGIDIYSHRAALQFGLDTVAVLAHGLDRIYPSVHRKTAIEMLDHGGLLTEFTSGTNADRQNFVMRNRIVAGLADATVVVQSAAKGGSLITADIAESYQRDVFAFPGRIGDEFSAGCNNLIRNNHAVLLQSAEELVKALSWDAVVEKPQAIQRELFLDLTPEEEVVYNLLQKSEDGLQINTLVVNSNIPINRMTGILFQMEMRGIIRALAGGVYRLI